MVFWVSCFVVILKSNCLIGMLVLVVLCVFSPRMWI